MANETITCKIEHHAVLFALLSKYAITQSGEAGKDSILRGMTKYGNERGARMAKRALAHGDELTTFANQAYGEWKTDYPGQMDFGTVRTEPTLQTFIAKCAWCDAWKKHDLIDYGKYYCVNVDNAVYQGFNSDFLCTPITTSLSWGGDRCVFDWGNPLSKEEAAVLPEKKKQLGTSCMKDFNFHTAHLLHTVGNTLKEDLGESGELAIKKAIAEYIEKFGQEYFDVLGEINHAEF